MPSESERLNRLERLFVALVERRIDPIPSDMLNDAARAERLAIAEEFNTLRREVEARSQ